LDQGNSLETHPNIAELDVVSDWCRRGEIGKMYSLEVNGLPKSHEIGDIYIFKQKLFLMRKK
jgi:hypothetical protein